MRILLLFSNYTRYTKLVTDTLMGYNHIQTAAYYCPLNEHDIEQAMRNPKPDVLIVDWLAHQKQSVAIALKFNPNLLVCVLGQNDQALRDALEVFHAKITVTRVLSNMGIQEIDWLVSYLTPRCGTNILQRPQPLTADPR